MTGPKNRSHCFAVQKEGNSWWPEGAKTKHGPIALHRGPRPAWLTEFLRRDFAAEEPQGDVEIFMDWRESPRRQVVQPREAKGRDWNRNWDVGESLRELGCAFVPKLGLSPAHKGRLRDSRPSRASAGRHVFLVAEAAPENPMAASGGLVADDRFDREQQLPPRGSVLART